MARMNWKRTLLAVAASLGLSAGAIHSGRAQTPASADRVVTVGLNDQYHRCKVLFDWNLPDGGKAFQVRTLDTNETLTLVRDEADGAGKPSQVRIYRWADAKTPPVGAPIPVIHVTAPMPTAAIRPPAQPQQVRAAVSASPPQPIITEGDPDEVRPAPITQARPKSTPVPAYADQAPWTSPQTTITQQPGMTLPTPPVASSVPSIPDFTAIAKTAASALAENLPEPTFASDQVKMSIIEQLRGHLRKNAVAEAPVAKNTIAAPAPITITEQIVPADNGAAIDRNRASALWQVTHPIPAAPIESSSAVAKNGVDRTRTGPSSVAQAVPRPIRTTEANESPYPTMIAPPIIRSAPDSAVGETIVITQTQPALIPPPPAAPPAPKVVRVTETIIQVDSPPTVTEIVRPASPKTVAHRETVVPPTPKTPSVIATDPCAVKPGLPTEIVMTTGPVEAPTLPPPPQVATAPNAENANVGNRRFPGLFKGNARPQQANAFTPPIDPNAPAQPIMIPVPVMMHPAPSVAYGPPGNNGIAQAGYAPIHQNMAMERGDPSVFRSNDPRVSQMIRIMADGLLPSQREWAVMRIAECDARVHPVIHAILAHYAVHDQSGSVRAACIHQLGRTNAPAPYAHRVASALRNDPDVRVQHEVGEIASHYKIQ